MAGLNVLNLPFSISWIDISIASLIVFLGLIVGRFAGKIAGKLAHRLALDRMLVHLGWKRNPEQVVEKAVSYIVYAIAIGMAIVQLKILLFLRIVLWVLSILLIAIVCALGIKEFLPNLISGFYLRSLKHLRPREKVKLADVRGTVKKIGLLETKIITADNDIMLFPNSYFAKRIMLRIKR